MAVSSALIDAQTALIGSMLIDERCIPFVVAETREEDYDTVYRSVFLAIKRLFQAGAAVDPVTVLHALGGHQEYREFIGQCMEATPSAANAGHYAKILREQATARRIRSLAEELAQMEDLGQMRKTLEDAASLAADKQSARIGTMAELLAGFADRHSRAAQYLSWPIRELDTVLYAEPGDFIIVGGRPSTGKTALTIQCALHWAATQKVGYFSLETSREKVIDRLMSHAAQIDLSSIKRNDLSQAEWSAYADSAAAISSRAKLEVVEAAGMSVADIQAYAVMRGYEIIVIDYLQLIHAQGESRTHQVTAISLGLHTMAQSKKITVVALSQMARQGQQREGFAGMDSLRESGQIEQDADVVMILNLEQPKEPPAGQNRILRIEKNKEGICPQIKLEFEGRFQTFRKAAPEGENTLQKYVAEGKRVRRQNAQKAAQAQQWEELPEQLDMNNPF